MFFWIGISVSLYGQTPDSIKLKEIDSLINISTSLRSQGKYMEGFSLAEAAVDLSRQYLKNDSLKLAKSLVNLAVYCRRTSKFEQSERLFFEALDIRGRLLGKDNVSYAVILASIGNLYADIGRYDESEKFHLEAKEIIKDKIGENSVEYLRSLTGLSYVYFASSQYEKAETSCIEIKNVARNLYGENDAEYAGALDNLGAVYHNLFKNDEAIKCHKAAIAISIKNHQENHPDFANALTNLSNIYMEIGNYKEADKCLSKAKEIYLSAYGDESLEYMTVVNNQAILYFKMGNYESALKENLKVNHIREKKLGKKHIDYIRSLINLGESYRALGQYDKEMECLKEAQSVAKEIWGEENLFYAKILNNLGLFYISLKKWDLAESLMNKAMLALEKSIGKNNSEYAIYLTNFALVYYAKKEYNQSILLNSTARDIFIKYSGESASLYTTYQIAIASEQLDSFERAQKCYNKTIDIIKQKCIVMSTFLTPSEMLPYLKNNENVIGSYYSFCFEHPNTPLIKTGFDNALFFKSAILENILILKRLITNTDTVSYQIYSNWQSIRRRLSAEYSKDIKDRSKVEELEGKANKLEKQLLSIPGFAEAQRQYNWEEVRAALPNQAAAIEFIHFHYYNPDPTDSTFYAALLLRPADTVPIFIPLCEERQLKVLLTRTDSTEQYYQNLYRPSAADTTSLWQAIWAPIVPYLSEGNSVYFSPSGLLHRLNLGAIQPVQGQRVGDRYQLVQLGSTRQLVTDSTRLTQTYHPTDNPNNDAILFGGIAYDLDTNITITNQPVQTDSTIASEPEFSRGVSFAEVDSTIRGGKFQPLSGTFQEVKAIESNLNRHRFHTIPYLSSDATEEAFKKIGQDGHPSPRVLHIATHGFFFPDPEVKTSQTFGFNDEPVFKTSDNPMIRSGLALAGANYAWQFSRPLRSDMEDGILTAYEISQMNLSNTELVVLSACETGLGDLTGNEGVYGLQRAFKIAGAKHLIMSLWKVPDAATSKLMQAFYANWLGSANQKPMPIPDAFRAAQKTMQADRLYRNPYYWAGFVLVE